MKTGTDKITETSDTLRAKAKRLVEDHLGTAVPAKDDPQEMEDKIFRFLETVFPTISALADHGDPRDAIMGGDSDGTVALMSKIPDCDYCHGTNPYPAEYDGATLDGPWAFMCQSHYDLKTKYNELGWGKGQKIVYTK